MFSLKRMRNSWRWSPMSDAHDAQWQCFFFFHSLLNYWIGRGKQHSTNTIRVCFLLNKIIVNRFWTIKLIGDSQHYLLLWLRNSKWKKSFFCKNNIWEIWKLDSNHWSKEKTLLRRLFRIVTTLNCPQVPSCSSICSRKSGYLWSSLWCRWTMHSAWLFRSHRC